jgi:hypothetical protein
MKLLAALLATITPAVTLCAQSVSDADALLARGEVAPAESLYFRAAQLQPRNPEARFALGNYLSARGALRVGAVLLEEARNFGADQRRVAIELAPIYRALGDWRALVTLPASPLTPTERAQATWLASHPPTLEMNDSVAVAYRPSGDTATLGRVTLRIGDLVLDATIDPRRSGIVLDASRRTLHEVTPFGGANGAPGAAERVEMGAVSFGNAPVSFATLGGRTRAILGLDVLRPFAPTFDASRRVIVLRRAGRVSRTAAGERSPLLTSRGRFEVVRSGRFVPLGSAEMSRLLECRRWTLDTRRGDIVVE